MTYTVSHRQAGVTKTNVKGLVRHEYRDIDRQNGKETSHSNERIVPSRTPLNVSLIFIDGQPVPLENTEQISEELDRRLESVVNTRTNKKTGETKQIALRSDAKVVRNIVLQLDPEFTRSSEYLTGDDCPDEHYTEVTEHLESMIDFYGDLYGRHNLLSATMHLDEKSPHVHLMVTPIDEEGRLRNASFIADGRGPKSGFARNDRNMREHLAARGYDVDPEPRRVRKSHMSVEEYARYEQEQEDLKAAQVEIEDRELKIGRREKQVEARSAEVRIREHQVASQTYELNGREAQLRTAAAAVERREQEAAESRSKAVEQQREAAEARRLADEAREAHNGSWEAAKELISTIKGVQMPASQVKKVVSARDAAIAAKKAADAREATWAERSGGRGIER